MATRFGIDVRGGSRSSVLRRSLRPAPGRRGRDDAAVSDGAQPRPVDRRPGVEQPELFLHRRAVGINGLLEHDWSPTGTQRSSMMMFAQEPYLCDTCSVEHVVVGAPDFDSLHDARIMSAPHSRIVMDFRPPFPTGRADVTPVLHHPSGYVR